MTATLIIKVDITYAQCYIVNIYNYQVTVLDDIIN